MKNHSNSFTILGIHHIALAPKDPEKAFFFFNSVLKLACDRKSRIEDQKVEVSMLSLPESKPHLEILDSSAYKEGPVKKFLSRVGGGIHHIAIDVDNIDATLEHLKNNDIELIHQNPTEGENQSRIIFVHPRATGGILVELVERKNC